MTNACNVHVFMDYTSTHVQMFQACSSSMTC